jgi:la-related protein 1
MSLICNFKRMKDISADNELIKFVCVQSDELELRHDAEGKDKIRKKEGWQEWVLAEAERDVTARNAGPPETEHPQASYSGVYAPTFQQPQALMEPSPMTNAGHFDHYPPQSQGFSPVPVTPSKMNGISKPKSPSRSTEDTSVTADEKSLNKPEEPLTNGTSSTKHTESDADVHHNDENRDLLVAVKALNSPEAKSPHVEHPPVNGSIAGYA